MPVFTPLSAVLTFVIMPMVLALQKRSWQQGNIEFSKFRVDAGSHLIESVTAIEEGFMAFGFDCYIAKTQKK